MALRRSRRRREEQQQQQQHQQEQEEEDVTILLDGRPPWSSEEDKGAEAEMVQHQHQQKQQQQQQNQQKEQQQKRMPLGIPSNRSPHEDRGSSDSKGGGRRRGSGLEPGPGVAARAGKKRSGTYFLSDSDAGSDLDGADEEEDVEQEGTPASASASASAQPRWSRGSILRRSLEGLVTASTEFTTMTVPPTAATTTTATSGAGDGSQAVDAAVEAAEKADPTQPPTPMALPVRPKNKKRRPAEFNNNNKADAASVAAVGMKHTENATQHAQRQPLHHQKDAQQNQHQNQQQQQQQEQHQTQKTQHTQQQQLQQQQQHQQQHQHQHRQQQNQSCRPNPQIPLHGPQTHSHLESIQPPKIQQQQQSESPLQPEQAVPCAIERKAAATASTVDSEEVNTSSTGLPGPSPLPECSPKKIQPQPQPQRGSPSKCCERPLASCKEELEGLRVALQGDMQDIVGVVLERLEILSSGVDLRRISEGSQGNHRLSRLSKLSIDSSPPVFAAVSITECGGGGGGGGEQGGERSRVRFESDDERAAAAVDTSAAEAFFDPSSPRESEMARDAISESDTDSFRHRGPVKSFWEAQEAFVNHIRTGSSHGSAAGHGAGGRRRSTWLSSAASYLSMPFGEEETEEATPNNNTTLLQRMRRKAQIVVDSVGFEWLACTLVVINAVLLGLQIEWQAQELTNETPQIFLDLEVIFCLVFTAELLLRLLAFPAWFPHHPVRQSQQQPQPQQQASGQAADMTTAAKKSGEPVAVTPSLYGGDSTTVTTTPLPAVKRRHGDWPWLLFDAVLVTFQIVEMAMTRWGNVQASGKSVNFTVVRILRVLRLIRAMRLVRVLKMVHELRALTTSILSSLKALVWALLLLLMVMYMIGVFFTEVVSDRRISSSDEEVTTALVQYWGTLGDSIYSLYMAITGGQDWGDLVAPLKSDIHIMLVPLFVAYIAFALLCMMNIITGLFLDQALRTAKRERDSYMIRTLQSLFDSADFDHNDRITWEEFERLAATPSMRYVFEQIDLSHEEASTLFKLLDTNHRGKINRDEFRSGCNSLRGPAKALDIAFLKKELDRIVTRSAQQSKLLKQHVKYTRELLPILFELKSSLLSKAPC